MTTPSEPSIQGPRPGAAGSLRRPLVRLGVLATAVAMAVFAAAGLGSAATAPAQEFVISSRVLDGPSCSMAAVLLPGLERCLEYTVTNTDAKNQITVTSLDVAAVVAPSGCPASNLDVSRARWSGSVVVPKGRTAVVGTGVIMLVDAPTPADGCRGVHFGLTLTGLAINAGTLPTPAPSATPTPTPAPTSTPKPTKPPKPTPAPTPTPKPTRSPRAQAPLRLATSGWTA